MPRKINWEVRANQQAQHSFEEEAAEYLRLRDLTTRPVVRDTLERHAKISKRRARRFQDAATEAEYRHLYTEEQ